MEETEAEMFLINALVQLIIQMLLPLTITLYS